MCYFLFTVGSFVSFWNKKFRILWKFGLLILFSLLQSSCPWVLLWGANQMCRDLFLCLLELLPDWPQWNVSLHLPFRWRQIHVFCSLVTSGTGRYLSREFIPLTKCDGWAAAARRPLQICLSSLAGGRFTPSAGVSCWECRGRRGGGSSACTWHSAGGKRKRA